MHIHYYKNSHGLPAAIITLGEALEFSEASGTIAAYEVEVSDGNVYSTSYKRSRDEYATWRPSTRDALERMEGGFVRLFPALSPCFWSSFVDGMATEIADRLRLREEWLTKQAEKREQQPALHATNAELA